MISFDPEKELEEAIKAEEKYGTPSISSNKTSHSSELIFDSFNLYSEATKSQLFKEYCDRLGNKFNGFGYDFINSFNNINSDTNSVLFRSSNNDKELWPHLAPFKMWLSVVTNKAQKIFENSDVQFKSIDLDFMKHISGLSPDVMNVRKVRKELLSKGIIIIYEPSIGTLKTDAAVTLLPSGSPVIGMTLRYSRIDYYWFTLLHELAHIALHLDNLNGYIADDFENQDQSSIEKQADRLALESIVPRANWRRTTAFKRQDLESINQTAKDFSVHPALIAGRIRKEFNSYNKFSDIVNQYDIRDILSV